MLNTGLLGVLLAVRLGTHTVQHWHSCTARSSTIPKILLKYRILDIMFVSHLPSNSFNSLSFINIKKHQKQCFVPADSFHKASWSFLVSLLLEFYHSLECSRVSCSGQPEQLGSPTTFMQVHLDNIIQLYLILNKRLFDTLPVSGMSIYVLLFCLSFFMSVCLPVCMSACLHICLSIYPSVYKSIRSVQVS